MGVVVFSFLFFVFLPLVAKEFVRGDFPAHFAVELGAEERHAEAELQRDPLVFRRQGCE